MQRPIDAILAKLQRRLPGFRAHQLSIRVGANTGDVLKRYKKVLVPELNAGQLCHELRARYLVNAVSYGKVQGQPFLASEIENKIDEMLQ